MALFEQILTRSPIHNDLRRKQMAQAVGGDEMDSVRKYFNTTGFERWNKIYGETDVRAAFSRNTLC